MLIRRISTEGCGPFWWFFVGWRAVYQDLHPAMKRRIYIGRRPLLRKVGHHWIRSLVDANAHVSGKRDGPPLKMYYFFGVWCVMYDVWFMDHEFWLAIYDTIYYYPKHTHTYAYIDIHICLLSIYDRSYTIFANLLPWLQEGHNHQFRIFAVTQNQPVQKLPVPGSIHSHYFHIRGWSSTQ